MDFCCHPAGSQSAYACTRSLPDFIRDLRAHPEKLNDLELSMEEVLDRASPFISANIKRHVNAAFQQIRKQEEN